jgi:hypothetical protein
VVLPATAVEDDRHKHLLHERENMKAQHLFLPPKTITLNKVVATDVQGTVSKEELRQHWAVDLMKLSSSTLEERHPLVAKMIDTYLK